VPYASVACTQPIDFGEVPEIVEGSKASLKIVGVDGDVKVAVFAGQSPNECRDTPAAANPDGTSRIVDGSGGAKELFRLL
jgi:hypothetical protein